MPNTVILLVRYRDPSQSLAPTVDGTINDVKHGADTIACHVAMVCECVQTGARTADVVGARSNLHVQHISLCQASRVRV